ncbi:FLU chloroplast alternative spliced version l-FLP [Chlorella sorokiniana]|uniref:FLU chloroplast alternative spliced version l-FLP n=1 Tax=Chlorella sorokiniana TaxID=3076 RepID=A0A2P6TQX6_CHLSO|nr:FLU chloroplast alternative spliced version l-FLP [Chlorella sorokiniana]|eukprot:PRW56470.1 FLU chloroplast alternative spliced version l-FLP [Chlorella sorokiniana]
MAATLRAGALLSQQRPQAAGPSVRCSAAPVQRAAVQAGPREQQGLGKLAAGLLGAAAALSLALSPPALAAEPFLKSTGARGILVEEEEKALRLREAREAEAEAQLQAARQAYVEELRAGRAAAPDEQLCATPFGVDVVGITEFVALTGALVGGVSARRRKQELERLNEQLRTINTQLRQQARAGTLYAPGLTYVPSAPMPDSVFGGNGAAAAAAAVAQAQAAVAAPELPPAVEPAPPASASPAVSLMSQDDDEAGPEGPQCTQALKDGKRLLKDGSAAAAMVRFEKALMLAKVTGDRVKERRATRGLAAAARMQGQLRQAVKHLERVLEISRDIREHVGDADAYGTIADIYTDLGDFEKAAQYYDKYIKAMDDSVV